MNVDNLRARIEALPKVYHGPNGSTLADGLQAYVPLADVLAALAEPTPQYKTVDKETHLWYAEDEPKPRQTDTYFSEAARMRKIEDER